MNHKTLNIHCTYYIHYILADSVIPLVLYTVASNGWGTDIVLQVPHESANPTEKGNISGRPYYRIMTVALYHMDILYINITHNINCHDGTVIYFTKY